MKTSGELRSRAPTTVLDDVPDSIVIGLTIAIGGELGIASVSGLGVVLALPSDDVVVVVLGTMTRRVVVCSTVTVVSR